MDNARPDQAPDASRSSGRSSAHVTQAISSAGDRRKWHGLPFALQLALAIIVLALVQGFVAKPFQVPSASMEPTLRVGDRVLVERWATPGEQDIVVFRHGATWNDARLPQSTNAFKAIVKAAGDLTGIGPSNTAYTVKRLIGLPGRTVACCTDKGAVTLDGRALSEPYLADNFPFDPGRLDCTTTPASQRCFPALLVPAGRMLVMGDNRTNSADSVVGCRGRRTADGCAVYARLNQTVGVVGVRVWPLGRLGLP
ncbi:MAG: signal peptidase I [Nostocoides sp.]